MLESLNLLTTLIIGLYAGSLLTEAMILVPYWRHMDPSKFFKLHGTLGPRLFRYYAPLTTVAVGLALIAAIANQGENPYWNIAAGLCASALLIFFLYFSKANKSFADHSLAEHDLGNELARWSRWHWLRTVLVILALGASIGGHGFT
jgi:hypothetical protein